MLIVEHNSDLLDIRASKGISKSFVTESTSYRSGERQVMQLFLDMVRSDPIMSSCMDITIEAATHNGYCFYPKPTKEGVKFEKEAQEAKLYFDETLDYDMVQDNIYANLFLYGDCPVEKRKEKSAKINELHVLEMTELDIKYTQHGKILEFIQGSTSDMVSWPAKEIMFIQSKRIGSRVRSYAPLESAAVAYSTLIYTNNYMLEVMKNLPPKLMYVLKNADRATRAAFIQNLRLAKVNPSVDLVVNGEAIVQNPKFDFNGLFEVLKYARQQVLMITRVPPVWVGMIEADGANRGNSEAQISSFENRIRKMQQRVASAINKELLPELGFDNVWFKYNPPSFKAEKEILENAERLSNMGVKPEALAYYLSDRGIMVGSSQINQEAKIKDKDLMDSRVRKDRTTKGISSELNSQGVSEAGAKKLNIRKSTSEWYYEPGEE